MKLKFNVVLVSDYFVTVHRCILSHIQSAIPAGFDTPAGIEPLSGEWERN